MTPSDPYDSRTAWESFRIPVHRPFFGREEVEAVARLMEDRWVGKGAVTTAFEHKVAEFLGVRNVIAVDSGTAALHLALGSLELEPGDEVIVPALTFPSPVQAIFVLGARPVFCEVRKETLNLDVSDALERVTPRTRAIVPVHYGGVPCDMDELVGYARERNIAIIDDAAHAFGSSYKGRKVGTLADLTCFSFDPIKNITCAGGGAIATDDEVRARAIRPRRNLGIDMDSWERIDQQRFWHYQVITKGLRYNLTNLHAAIGLVQLERLEEFKARKQAIVRRYDEALGSLDGIKLIERNLPDVFPFSYVIRMLDGKRDDLISHLRQGGIGSTVQFIPNHLHPAFVEYRVPLPVTETLYDEIVTLPLYFEMSDADVEDVIGGIRSFLGGESSEDR